MFHSLGKEFDMYGYKVVANTVFVQGQTSGKILTDNL